MPFTIRSSSPPTQLLSGAYYIQYTLCTLISVINYLATFFFTKNKLISVNLVISKLSSRWIYRSLNLLGPRALFTWKKVQEFSFNWKKIEGALFNWVKFCFTIISRDYFATISVKALKVRLPILKNI